MAKLVWVWHAQLDERTCPICKALNGYAWTFDTAEGVENLSNTGLTHPEYGLVWTPGQGSNAHGHHGYNCRCTIDYDDNASDFSDLVEAARDLLRALEEANQETAE